MISCKLQFPHSYVVCCQSCTDFQLWLKKAAPNFWWFEFSLKLKLFWAALSLTSSKLKINHNCVWAGTTWYNPAYLLCCLHSCPWKPGLGLPHQCSWLRVCPTDRSAKGISTRVCSSYWDEGILPLSKPQNLAVSSDRTDFQCIYSQFWSFQKCTHGG